MIVYRGIGIYQTEDNFYYCNLRNASEDYKDSDVTSTSIKDIENEIDAFYQSLNKVAEENINEKFDPDYWMLFRICILGIILISMNIVPIWLTVKYGGYYYFLLLITFYVVIEEIYFYLEYIRKHDDIPYLPNKEQPEFLDKIKIIFSIMRGNNDKIRPE